LLEQTDMPDRRRNPAAREQFDALRIELQRRFGQLCRDWTRESFEHLVTCMARVQLRYEPVSGLPERTNGRY
jgi:hypothetical protein